MWVEKEEKKEKKKKRGRKMQGYGAMTTLGMENGRGGEEKGLWLIFFFSCRELSCYMGYVNAFLFLKL